MIFQRVVHTVGVEVHASAGIVFDDCKRLLLVQRGRPPEVGSWTVPGGKRLPGESAQENCRREVLEETGLEVTVGRLAGRVRRTAPDAGVYVIDDFLCTVSGGSLTPGDDAADAGWFDLASMSSLVLVPMLFTTLDRWKLLPR